MLLIIIIIIIIISILIRSTNIQEIRYKSLTQLTISKERVTSSIDKTYNLLMIIDASQQHTSPVHLGLRSGQRIVHYKKFIPSSLQLHEVPSELFVNKVNIPS